MPAVLVLVVVLFLSNGGVDAIKRWGNSAQIPAGAANAVTNYYAQTAIDDPGGAQFWICRAQQTTWLTGQTAPTSDTSRRASLESITARSKAGSAYDITGLVTSTDSAGSKSTSSVTLRVIKESSSYRVCGGTTP